MGLFGEPEEGGKKDRSVPCTLFMEPFGVQSRLPFEPDFRSTCTKVFTTCTLFVSKGSCSGEKRGSKYGEVEQESSEFEVKTRAELKDVVSWVKKGDSTRPVEVEVKGPQWCAFTFTPASPEEGPRAAIRPEDGTRCFKNGVADIGLPRKLEFEESEEYKKFILGVICAILGVFLAAQLGYIELMRREIARVDMENNTLKNVNGRHPVAEDESHRYNTPRYRKI